MRYQNVAPICNLQAGFSPRRTNRAAKPTPCLFLCVHVPSRTIVRCTKVGMHFDFTLFPCRAPGPGRLSACKFDSISHLRLAPAKQGGGYTLRADWAHVHCPVAFFSVLQALRKIFRERCFVAQSQASRPPRRMALTEMPVRGLCRLYLHQIPAFQVKCRRASHCWHR
jgi:hypothetical protein